MLLDIIGVDPDRLAMTIGGREGNLVEHALHHGLQSPRADILHRGIDGDRDIGERVDGAVGDIQRHALGMHQRNILLDQGSLWFGQDTAHIVAGQRFQFDADRQAPLQLRNQIRRLGDMKRAGGNE